MTKVQVCQTKTAPDDLVKRRSDSGTSCPCKPAPTISGALIYCMAAISARLQILKLCLIQIIILPFLLKQLLVRPLL
jgi:hypothetical protein